MRDKINQTGLSANRFGARIGLVDKARLAEIPLVAGDNLDAAITSTIGGAQISIFASKAHQYRDAPSGLEIHNTCGVN